MHAASREALAALSDQLDSQITTVAQAATVGTQLFDAVEVLDGDRQLRVAIADQAAPASARAGLVRDVFASAVAPETQQVLEAAVTQQWSTPRELRDGLVDLGRQALLVGARLDGKLETVESELFELARVLDREPELTALLSDKATDPERKRSLAASVLYGKVTMFTETLVLQAIGRPEFNPIDDVDALSERAAAVRGHTVARVTSASALSAQQTEALAQKLGQVYGTEISVHTVIDESLLGGLSVRVGDELIDGSIAAKIARLRADMARVS
ncbi:F0F1 ATP synthase subunit delta [Corynebacterium uberis]|uniref:F0F1 ATP synthase subunit delta n=1 Tax=Corynebacterium TaxID=1716 RepID=UPI001D0A6C8D|nr:MULTISPECIES: F0F1 ATP synthase subunit delta [Corynebacterium]MCZ9309052.1 F0F1 ATP synthase subunit delta [Corynebacterium sp. c6VSa_13]UDL76682.1 F0F1 ATP synthase subunit delta [Corynebacterium uberis]UDL78895.1 F0F1 ATP synthase subunit delta [Corynebacterium uberis]UDL81173.1 F0F1 ATP synthase subunit delta [Corynebacterium uberis]UDL83311.1 F0F1 ATP synthase subunit delta [Corynebacterium uberis]